MDVVIHVMGYSLTNLIDEKPTFTDKAYRVASILKRKTKKNEGSLEGVRGNKS